MAQGKQIFISFRFGANNKLSTHTERSIKRRIVKKNETDTQNEEKKTETEKIELKSTAIKKNTTILKDKCVCVCVML